MNKEFFDAFKQAICEFYVHYEHEKNSGRLLSAEGNIYGLYVQILHAVNNTDTQQIVNYLAEVDAIERSCLMDHYCYESFHTSDYRFEFPCRTSAIIVDILEQTLTGKKLNRGTAWLVRRILKERSAFLKIGYSEYQTKADNLSQYL